MFTIKCIYVFSIIIFFLFMSIGLYVNINLDIKRGMLFI